MEFEPKTGEGQIYSQDRPNEPTEVRYDLRIPKVPNPAQQRMYAVVNVDSLNGDALPDGRYRLVLCDQETLSVKRAGSFWRLIKDR